MKTKISMFLAALVLAACGGGGGNIDPAANIQAPSVTPVADPVADPVVDPGPQVPAGPAELAFLADGVTLHAATTTATGYTETGVAAIPAAGLVANHQIFSIVVHPSKRWVYVASASSAWGNARLSRFAVDWTTGSLTYVDSILMTSTGPSCATSDNCAPVGLGITDNGSRLIVEENSVDTYLTYAIGTDGTLSFVTEAAPSITSDHGVGINAAGTYVYHGSMAYSRAGDVITALNNSGQMGNASTVLNVGGTEQLYTTLNVDQVGVLSLADPANPAVIASLNPDPTNTGNSSVFMDVTKDGKRMIVVGDNSIAVVDFDGSALTVKDHIIPTGRGRGAAFNADGTLAMVAFQTGGAKLYTVATDGTLTEVGSVSSSNPTRAVVFSSHP